MSAKITFQERESIERLIKADFSLGAIASVLHRSKGGIQKEVQINGGRDGYTAQKAQKRKDVVMFNRSKIISKMMSGYIPDKYLELRVKALESALISLSLDIEKLKSGKKSPKIKNAKT